MKIDGKTGLYGIVADPIKHSISPLMHSTAFEALGINDVYLAFEIKKEQLEDYIQSVRTLNIKGFNVSMPYKTTILPYLDELTFEAQLCKAVNTVKNENGRLIGHISDGKGFFLGCQEKGWSVKDEKVVVLGAGGAAISIIVEAALQGAKEIVVYNRSDKPIIKELAKQLNCLLVLKSFDDMEQLRDDLKNTYLLIQATNVGMHPNVEGNLIPNEDFLPQDLKVADIIYNPEETQLLKMCKHKGLEYVNGKNMILYQGAVSFEFWTGRKMPIDIVKKALEME